MKNNSIDCDYVVHVITQFSNIFWKEFLPLEVSTLHIRNSENCKNYCSRSLKEQKSD